MTSAVAAHRLAAHPQGVPQESDFFCDMMTLSLMADDQLRLRITHASLDPALRPRMNAVSAYAGAVGLGEVIPAPAWTVGSFVSGMFGWQEEIAPSATGLWSVDPRRAALPDWLGALGCHLSRLGPVSPRSANRRQAKPWSSLPQAARQDRWRANRPRAVVPALRALRGAGKLRPRGG